jgi:hypothetical protein
MRRRLRRVEERSPILVYQMGKVGSRTVVETLEGMALERPVIHLHTLDPARLERSIARRASARSTPEHLLCARILAPKLAAGPFPCRIVTLTRDPVDRAISFAFQNLAAKAPGISKAAPDLAEMARAVTRMLRTAPGHADPSCWFDRELKGIFGVDVFREPYDAASGFTLLEGTVPVLVIRMEDLDRALAPALGRLLDLDPTRITTVRANVGATKAYSHGLRALKSSYRLPPDLAARVLGTRYVRHFYPEETSAMRHRWTESGRTSERP